VNRADLDLFRDRYESLAGKVHYAADLTDAVHIVSHLVAEVNASRVALGSLPAEARAAVRENLPQVELVDAGELRTDVAAEIDQAEVGIGWAEFAIAFTGTIVEATDNDAMRLVSSLPRMHIALLPASEIVPDLKDAAPRLRSKLEENSNGYTLSFISGPSRTGDIEMKLILGVHGPQASHVIVIGVPPE
jgi:L-lactate dehydrogenase complex protein LldG